MSTTTTDASSAGTVICADIDVDYGNGDWGLRGASLTLPSGSSTAIVGPSGSGKSTLLNAIAGLAPVTGGLVTIGGMQTTSVTPAAAARIRREQIGVVFQQGLLLNELSALDNVALPLRLNGASRTQARARARHVLERLGLSDLVSRRPWQMSGGQRQRLAVARAVVHDPAVVLADEPTGALDVENSLLVLNLLLECCLTLGATLALVTHDERIAERCSHRINVLDGRVTAA